MSQISRMRFGFLFALGAAALLAVRGHGEEASPFVPRDSGQAAAQTTGGPLDTLELRGVSSLGGTTLLTLYDPNTSRGFTVELDGTVNGFKVSDYKPEDDSVLVESGGLSKRIRLRKSQIIAVTAPPLPPTMPIPGTANVTNVNPAPGQPGFNPANANAAGANTAQMSDEEVRQRMQRVAEEIRRRREMRREMLQRAQQQGQNAVPIPNPPQ